ncbi:MAG: hypothetical protein IJJ69_03580 [Oscillospiraceae bacterium]|nr:hypothetical protein [Oscillospiraceae bacterium]
MKTINLMLTASVMFSVVLTGCGIQQEETSVAESTMPDIQIATIPVETKSAATPPPAVAETEAEAVPAENSDIPEETSVSSKPEKTLNYNTVLFDKAIFAALLDSITGGTDYYFVSDPDRDGFSELLVSIPQTESSSQNLILEGLGSAGIYYYDATGVQNDFFVLDPVTGDVYLNENTVENGLLVSQEYFQWTGSKWQSACMLYNGSCYWNYQEITVDEFLANADAMLGITPAEDIFNITFTGTPESAANAFYQYLAGYFKTEHPVSADIDGDGTTEQIISVQNLSKSWCANVRSLYDENSFFNIESLSNIHTTCFVLDTASDGRVRIRSENFDRRYRFTEAGGKLFAYDDTNSMQTVQYSAEKDGFGKRFLSISMMMN